MPKKLKKIFKKKMPGGEALKPKPSLFIKLPKIKPKQGKWCDYYEGRLPYPIECQNNKDAPIGKYSKHGEIIETYNRPNCKHCRRSVDWKSWKMGDWDKIKKAIKDAEDLRDMPAPNKEI